MRSLCSTKNVIPDKKYSLYVMDCKISFPSYSQIHVVQTLSFKKIYYMSGLLPYLGSKTFYFFLEIPIDYWNV